MPADLPWPTFTAENGSVATRDAGGTVMNAIATALPELVGGSADLDPSTKTYFKNCGDFPPGNYAGRNIHYGVREHAMAAATNGIALHGGLLPFARPSSTSSTISSRRCAWRALTEVRSIYVFTHDSVFLGEDGPTHQPIEQLAMLRAMPNCYVVRPADSLETLEAWKLAVAAKGAAVGARAHAPEAAVPGARDAAVAKGAYVLADAPGGNPDLILIATGSEVSLAVDAKKMLDGKGVRTRVVSMPCWELFEAAPQSYRDEVLPPAVTARMSIEAAATFGWAKYVGDRGFAFGIDHFGTSAPAPTSPRPIGFTPENVAQTRARPVCPRHPLGENNEEHDPATARRRAERMARQPPTQHVCLRRAASASSITDCAGMTSNPTIFEKAIGAGNDYDEQLAKLIGSEKSADALFWDLAIQDIQSACDAFRPVYDSSGGNDGFVSLEVSPLLAHDTAGTIAMAEELWGRVDRPNVMIKIPGTKEGLPAIEESIYRGFNINVTLIFSVEMYEKAARAYIKGLQRRAGDGKPIDKIRSVNSVFVSRIDTVVDKMLQNASPRATSSSTCLGKAGIANLKLTYQKFKELFDGDDFAPLKAAGAAVQRPLWASTSTKNPHYPDLMYVETVVGPDTVNTMPPTTLDALLDHGNVVPDTVETDLREAHATSCADCRTRRSRCSTSPRDLQTEGVKLFSDSFAALLGAIVYKQKLLASGGADRVHSHSVRRSRSYDGALDQLRNGRFPQADLGARCDALVERSRPRRDHQEVARMAGHSAAHARRSPGSSQLRAPDAKDMFDFAVVCGMGGSSLAPDILADTFGTIDGYPQLYVLDSTCPQQIKELEGKIDIRVHALHHLEQERHDHRAQRVLRLLPRKGLQRDSARHRRDETSSPLPIQAASSTSEAQDDGLPRRFRERPEHRRPLFGALVRRHRAVGDRRIRHQPSARPRARRDACQRPQRRSPHGSGRALWRGNRRAGAQRTRQADDRHASRTSKPSARGPSSSSPSPPVSMGKGIVPIEGEALGVPDDYGDDRVFVYVGANLPGPAAGIDEKLRALEAAGHPVIRLDMNDAYDVGEQFYLWEIAVAAAGVIFGIDAFDQPNVQESKDNTVALLQQYAKNGSFDEPKANVDGPAFDVTYLSGSAGISAQTPPQALAGAVRAAPPARLQRDHGLYRA